MTTAPPPTPAVHRWWLWFVWIVGVGAYVLAVTNRTSLAAVGVDTAVRFEADASTLSLFAVIQLAVYSGMQVPVGLLLDRFGSRPVMVLGMLVMASGQLIMAFATDVGVAIVARVLIGAGDAAIFPGVLRVVAAWFPARQAPLVVQLTGIIGQLGQLVSVIPLALLLHATTWTIAFGALAGTCLLFAVLMLAVVSDRPPGAIVERRVVSSADLRQGFAESWRHPGTRLGFWSHFTPPLSVNAFILLWGYPFLTVGEGLSTAAASTVMSVIVIAGLVAGPVIGALSNRHPMRRSRLLVLPIVWSQVAVWLAVILWPTAAPLWLLLLLAMVIGLGGPGSLVAFDHARTFTPSHRLSTATGIINAGGFIAGLAAILAIGVAMDLQGAGTPDTYRLEAFRVAFLTQVPLWAIGITGIIVERRRTRRLLGIDPPRAPRR
ncbi:MFS transporter [Agromyces sp. SYSU T00194]|uniref:MFS transporter n=1 Tax=Agromyces chitinivorans TaxID=3158560 RepID=UPI00339666B1